MDSPWEENVKFPNIAHTWSPTINHKFLPNAGPDLKNKWEGGITVAVFLRQYAVYIRIANDQTSNCLKIVLLTATQTIPVYFILIEI